MLLLPERAITVLQLSVLPWFLARNPLQMITLMQSDINVNRYHLETVTNLRKVTYMFSSKWSPNSLLKYCRRTMTHPVYDCKYNTGFSSGISCNGYTFRVTFPVPDCTTCETEGRNTCLLTDMFWILADRTLWRHCCEADLQLMLMATMCCIARTQTSCLLSYNDFDHSCRAIRVACRLRCYCS